MLLLGSSVVALIVGHWYLVAEGISFGYLTKYTVAVIGALVLRSMIVTVLAWTWVQNLQIWWEIFFDAFFLIRIFIGLLVPIVFAAMTLGTLKVKNNQAATGILYVTVVLIIMGEMVHYGMWTPKF